MDVSKTGNLNGNSSGNLTENLSTGTALLLYTREVDGSDELFRKNDDVTKEDEVPDSLQGTKLDDNVLNDDENCEVCKSTEKFKGVQTDQTGDSESHIGSGAVATNYFDPKINSSADFEPEDGDVPNINGKTIQTQSIDLNSAPCHNNVGAGMESAKDDCDGKQDQVKNKQKKTKKTCSSKNTHSSMKFKDVIRANNKIQKTKNIDEEVGFRLDGFEDQLRVEIEGEGVSKLQS
ncbi:hypothetical protein L2E82_01604 [Cichorium intybus]|uniref:Uncharacterized protein n=1 Tax=Cichorium intybus TaxID=13427 RepID=A0ACB9H007_CICIN|nr:hypothetical protein L2E82_01604 [Cichorium intybus]